VFFHFDLIFVLWLSQIGLYEYEGCSVMTSVIQHPYGESDTDKVDSEYSQGMDGYVGYIGCVNEIQLNFLLIQCVEAFLHLFINTLSLQPYRNQVIIRHRFKY